jgi:FKBP-type peptidyl-prolyl cis-trans isomerase 2
MKKIAILAAMTIFLASCGSSNTSNTDTASTGRVVKSGDTISVQYTGKLEDGTIFDSSRQEDAKQSKNYSPQRTYEPLSFTVGAGQMIPGFDKGVIGMAVGEKKTLTIAPKDAYGEAVQEQTFPKTVFQDTILQDLPKNNFDDVISQTVPVTVLGAQATTAKVGESISAGGLTAIVKAIDDKNVTLEIANTLNPFYKKKLKVGLKGEFDGNTITIKKIGDKTVSVEILNKQNPFYGKKLIPGLSGKLPTGQTITIKKIEGDQVSAEIPNTHELAGKTLIFDIEVVSIK